jgi:hypothetical protein
MLIRTIIQLRPELSCGSSEAAPSKVMAGKRAWHERSVVRKAGHFAKPASAPVHRQPGGLAAQLRKGLKGRIMRKLPILAAALTLAAIPAAAKEPQPGTIVSESSVACGSQIRNKKETAQVLCQEYVVRTETTEYHVR